MKNLITVILFILSVMILKGQTTVPDTTQEGQKVIKTVDGAEYVGRITSESETTISLQTPAGINIDIPKTSVQSIKPFEGKVVGKKIYRPDPNKSRYLIAPSAFPIESGKGYCRDFCLVFPSINYGLSNQVSVQAGIIWFPGMPIADTPMFASAKVTLMQTKKVALAAGMQYFRIPLLDRGFGMGFLFGTATVGDRFNHGTVSLGWGYVEEKGNWDVANRPIVVLAGNKRMTENLALVTENWILPQTGLENTPLSLAVRFFGKKIAVDVGGIIILKSEGAPTPLLDFTYHFD